MSRIDRRALTVGIMVAILAACGSTAPSPSPGPSAYVGATRQPSPSPTSSGGLLGNIFGTNYCGAAIHNNSSHKLVLESVSGSHKGSNLNEIAPNSAAGFEYASVGGGVDCELYVRYLALDDRGIGFDLHVKSPATGSNSAEISKYVTLPPTQTTCFATSVLESESGSDAWAIVTFSCP